MLVGRYGHWAVVSLLITRFCQGDFVENQLMSLSVRVCLRIYRKLVNEFVGAHLFVAVLLTLMSVALLSINQFKDIHSNKHLTVTYETHTLKNISKQPKQHIQ